MSSSSRLFLVLLALVTGSLLFASPAAADTIVAWDEWADGQLSSDALAPTHIGALGVGDNIVRGKVVGMSDRFLFEIQDSLEILAAYVEITTFNSSGVVEISLSDLSSAQTLAASSLGTLAFDDFDHAVAGTYLAQVYGLSGEDPRFKYTWHLDVGPSVGSGTPNPEPGTLALFGLGAAGLALHRRRRLQAS